MNRALGLVRRLYRLHQCRSPLCCCLPRDDVAPPQRGWRPPPVRSLCSALPLRRAMREPAVRALRSAGCAEGCPYASRAPAIARSREHCMRRWRCLRCTSLLGARAWASICSQEVDGGPLVLQTGPEEICQRAQPLVQALEGSEHIQAGRRKVAAGRQCAFGQSGLAVTLATLRASQSAAQHLTAPNASLQDAAPHP